MKGKVIKGTILIATLLVCAAFAVGISTKAKDKDVILTGVYVGNEDVGGMSQEEAFACVRAKCEDILQKPIKLKTDSGSVDVLPEEIGLKWVNEDVCEEATLIGRSGNLIKRYKDKKELEKNSINLPLYFTIDEKMAKSYFKKNVTKLNVEAKDNGLIREDGEFHFIEGHEGVLVDRKASIAAIKEAYEAGINEAIEEFELLTKVDEPKGTEEELMAIKDVLGSFSTDYSTSAPGRCTNVANATSLINGTVLYPGEVFSVHDTISPITIENGYALAGAYENGTVVESVGGGVCQVSSTLFGAVIRSELEVVERSPHSMIVTYVEASQDAAIAGDYKDFKFKNTLNHPIYIEGYTVNKRVYFNVYGVEERDPNRTVSFETVIDSTDDPEPVINTCNEPIGYFLKVQGSHVGYKATLFKVVKVDGKEESRTEFNHSTYKASPAVYNVGIKSDDKDAVKAIKEAIKSGDIEKISSTCASLKKGAKKSDDDKDTKESKDKKDKTNQKKDKKSQDDSSDEDEGDE